MSFIRPLLEYADVVKDNCAQYKINKLEKILNEAARIVIGASRLVSIGNLLRETGWENYLQEGRNILDFLCFSRCKTIYALNTYPPLP